MKRYPTEVNEWRLFDAKISKTELVIGNWQVMQSWERPLMKRLAKIVTREGGDILEVGFGLGISATEIIKAGCQNYTVIEAHPVVADYARNWAKKQPVKVKVYEGFWEEIYRELPQKYDGILFDTFPLRKSDKSKNHYPFIPIAKTLLKKNGLFTYYSDEVIPFRNGHLNILLESFDNVEFLKVKNLKPWRSCQYWKKNYMVIPICKK